MKKTKKIQVLLSEVDFEDLSRIIINNAFKKNKIPTQLSAYVRLLIQLHIKENKKQ